MDWHSQNVAEASLLFYSHHYNELKCRIVENHSNLTLCNKLINNCCETFFNINRGLEDFYIELYHESEIIGVFNFTYEDLDRHIGLEDTNGNERRRNKKYIKFKKENDCCLLEFTVEYKDVMYLDKKERNYSYFYEDFIRGVANKAYKKLENKALKRIERIESVKFQDKRMSMESTAVIVSKPKKERRKDSAPLVCFLEKKTSSKESGLSVSDDIKFSKTWQGSKEKNENTIQLKTRFEKKDDFRFRKIKEKIKKEFKKEEVNLLDLVVIPKVKMDKNNMKLISENIYFPKRPKSEAIDNPNVSFEAFMSPKKLMAETKDLAPYKKIVRVAISNWSKENRKKNELKLPPTEVNDSKIIKIEKQHLVEVLNKSNQK